MVRNALMMAAMPAALLAASPATAAVELRTDLAGSLVTPLLAPQSDGTYAYSWLSPEWGLLVISASPAKAGVQVQDGAGRSAIQSLGITAIMPEPMTWAMMLVGMGVVGWVLRDRNHHTLRHISFS